MFIETHPDIIVVLCCVVLWYVVLCYVVLLCLLCYFVATSCRYHCVSFQVLGLSQQMEHLFVGLSLSDLAAVRQVRLRALTLQLLAKLHGGTAENKAACVQYLQVLNQLQR